MSRQMSRMIAFFSGGLSGLASESERQEQEIERLRAEARRVDRLEEALSEAIYRAEVAESWARRWRLAATTFRLRWIREAARQASR